MATAEASPRLHDSHPPTRKRPFSNFMRRFANLKSSAINGNHQQSSAKSSAKSRRQWKSNNPYPESALPVRSPRLSRMPDNVSSAASGHETSSIVSYETTSAGRVLSVRSAAPTVAETTYSKAPTAHTTLYPHSTFSSPQQSQESLTTTFTTLQSTAPSAMLAAPAVQTPNGGVAAQQTLNGAHPVTYNQAIANNILTDNASVLTLASSSKRHRRRSLDTNASVRAIAPSSLFGASRESLPLSVLSSNMETASGIFPVPSRSATAAGLASAERASVYSSSGIAPERNSYYAGKAPDGASIRSGLLGHGKTDSISGSITGFGHALASQREEGEEGGQSSRRCSDYREDEENEGDESRHEDEHTERPSIETPGNKETMDNVKSNAHAYEDKRSVENDV